MAVGGEEDGAVEGGETVDEARYGASLAWVVLEVKLYEKFEKIRNEKL